MFKIIKFFLFFITIYTETSFLSIKTLKKSSEITINLSVLSFLIASSILIKKNGGFKNFFKSNFEKFISNLKNGGINFQDYLDN